MNIKHILCPTDFSAHSRAAMDVAVTLAEAFGAKIDVAHSILSSGEHAQGYPQVQKEIEAERQRARNQLDHIHLGDVPMKRVLLEGLPAHEIIEYARSKSIDLIVMATHGRSGLTRFLMGSFAEEVLRKAPCPVLTLKSTLTDTQTNPVAETSITNGG